MTARVFKTNVLLDLSGPRNYLPTIDGPYLVVFLTDYQKLEAKVLEIENLQRPILIERDKLRARVKELEEFCASKGF